MNADDIKKQIIEEFSLFDDWMDRYDYLIEEGKKTGDLDIRYKASEFLIKGCQSQVWLIAEKQGDNIIFRGDSDAIITRGMISLLIRVYSGQPIDVVINADIAFLDEIGLKEQLSPTRSNGLHSMVEQMRTYACIFKNSK